MYTMWAPWRHGFPWLVWTRVPWPQSYGLYLGWTSPQASLTNISACLTNALVAEWAHAPKSSGNPSRKIGGYCNNKEGTESLLGWSFQPFSVPLNLESIRGDSDEAGHLAQGVCPSENTITHTLTHPFTDNRNPWGTRPICKLIPAVWRHEMNSKHENARLLAIYCTVL